jgi:serine/threonine-protein kinase
MLDLIGRYVRDRYRVLQAIGSGAMGNVYAAEDLHEQRIVALKVMRSDVDDPAAPERFLREAETLARVRSRNVVRIFNFERDMNHGILFVAMELAEGDDLSDILRVGRLRPPLVLRAIEEIAAGLSAAHAASIVHRDLKPANLKFRARRNGELRVKILDFGLARDRKSDVDLTDVGTAPGTVSYMQPEALEEKRVDSRADIYSLGVIAHEMVAGRPPFMGKTPAVIANGHLRKPPPRLESVVPELLPMGLEELVLEMLQKDPDARIATAEEVAVRARGIRETFGLHQHLTFAGAASDILTDWQLLAHL